MNSHSTNNRFVLRNATDSDNVSLAKLNQQTFFETYVNDYSTRYTKSDIKNYFNSSVSPESFAKTISDPKQATWIIEDRTNGKFAAFANAGPCKMTLPEIEKGKDGEIYRLYVLRHYQDDKLGETLMNVSLSWLEKQYPGRPIWLGVWKENLKAQEFHKQYNFKKVGERFYQIGEYKRPSFIMKKESSPK
uniref:GCN5-related N-acetyltransferase-like protein n=1 Tax=Adineta vaga TaxID=104782 RepID=B3G4F3_ADIVA|nr:GCN5-related N-acetyltransferase-like protein [Adineta vaga]